MKKPRKKYSTSTENDIRTAFLKILAKKPLAQMTITEVADEAGVSRSTFYEHYSNLNDVYEGPVSEFDDTVAPMGTNVSCMSGDDCGEQPFCRLLRHPGEFEPVVDEDRFISTFMSDTPRTPGQDLFGILAAAGYTLPQIEGLCRFQLSGCFSAAMSSHVDDAEWEEIRSAIDTFIRGGIKACLDAKTASNRGE